MTRAGNVLVLSTTVLLGSALAACSSDDASPASTAVVVTAAPSTDPPPPSSSSPPTTDPPPTTQDPNATLAAEVEADLLEAFRLGREASQDPFNEEKEQAALDRRVGVIADNLIATLADYRARNYAIRPNPDVPASVTVEGAPVFLGPNNEVADVQICEVDSWIVVEVGAGPSGADAIVNPDVVAYRSSVFLRNVGGTWRFEGGSEIERWEGSAECIGE